MAKQSARGFVLFQDKKAEEVKAAFSKTPVELKDCRIAYIDNLERFGKKRSGAGIFITGEIDAKYSSKDVVEFLTNAAESKKAFPDITTELENAFLKSVKSGFLEGNYIGLRLIPPYDTCQIYGATENVAQDRTIQELYLRTVESMNQTETFDPNPENPLMCIEVTTRLPVQDMIPLLESAFKGYTIGKYTTFRFI